MASRRDFLKTAATVGLVCGIAQARAEEALSPRPPSGADDRQYWLRMLEKIAMPVLTHLSRRELRKAMPVETFGSEAKLRKYTHLEAISRLLVGLGPWLEAEGLEAEETKLQKRFTGLALACLDAASDPKSPDFMNFSEGQQPLVDTAFLAQALIRAPRALVAALDERVRRQLISALKASRQIKPIGNNHVLFSSAVEAALIVLGEPGLPERLEEFLRQMLAWYGGDGAYHDGEYFRFDYYNSFVIHPTLIDVLGVLRKKDSAFDPAYEIVLKRGKRYAEVQERMIAPDGSYPVIGRSITYRCGAFQALGQMALLHELPPSIKPSQVRNVLTSVIRRTMDAPGTFDKQGWLRVGLCGAQIELGETYISTGSLYLCSTGFLPLGLKHTDPFWTDAAAASTWEKLWRGEHLPADRALRDERAVIIPTLKRSG